MILHREQQVDKVSRIRKKIKFCFHLNNQKITIGKEFKFCSWIIAVSQCLEIPESG
jgi:hypothetical protein